MNFKNDFRKRNMVKESQFCTLFSTNKYTQEKWLTDSDWRTLAESGCSVKRTLGPVSLAYEAILEILLLDNLPIVPLNYGRGKTNKGKL